MFWKCINVSISKTAKTDTVRFADFKFPKQYSKLEDLVMLCNTSLWEYFIPTLWKRPRFLKKQEYYMFYGKSSKKLYGKKYANISRRPEDVWYQIEYAKMFCCFWL